jgi:NitT/TauT family transport system substrate-binding protein
VLSLASVAFAGAVSGRVSAQRATLRVGSVPADPFAEAYYAQDMGFFAKAGLDVEITNFSNGAGSTTAVAGGAIDIGISTVTMMANAALHGVPMVYIAGGALYDDRAPSAVLCVAKNSTITEPKDFEGKVIAIAALHDGTHLGAAAYLIKNGIDLGKVSFIEMPFPVMGAALRRGTIAGAMIAEPFVTASADDIRVFALAEGAVAPRYMAGGWFALQTWVDANRDVARRFTAVIYQTARWANANRTRSGEILQKYSKIDQTTLDHMTRSTYAEELTPALIDPNLQWASRLKFTDRLVTAKEMIATP